MRELPGRSSFDDSNESGAKPPHSKDRGAHTTLASRSSAESTTLGGRITIRVIVLLAV